MKLAPRGHERVESSRSVSQSPHGQMLWSGRHVGECVATSRVGLQGPLEVRQRYDGTGEGGSTITANDPSDRGWGRLEQKEQVGGAEDPEEHAKRRVSVL